LKYTDKISIQIADTEPQCTYLVQDIPLRNFHDSHL